MINSCPAVKNHSRIIQDIDPAGPEIFRRNSFNTDKLEKIQYYFVLVSNLEIG
jgi:hypothetical protein